MTHINNENEHKRFISSYDFRFNKLQLSKIPFRCLLANHEIQITEKTCSLRSAMYTYGYKDKLAFEGVIRLAGEYESLPENFCRKSIQWHPRISSLGA